jgi:hypothetical protein
VIVRCNAGCKKSDGTTDASLDVDRDAAVCNTCGEDLNGVSSYAKLSMKVNGDILRNNAKKAFMFSCKTCDKQVETMMVSGVLVGKGCPQGGKGCRIDITKSMERAVELFGEDRE